MVHNYTRLYIVIYKNLKKNWPNRLPQKQLDYKTFSTKADVLDPANSFLDDKIRAGIGINVELIQSFKDWYIRITNTDPGSNAILNTAGIMYLIPTGITVSVQNDYQYLLKDHLYMNGGNLLLNGCAELIIS